MTERKINYKEVSDNIIRVIKGTNFDYFPKEAIKKFLNEKFLVTNLADRMGIRLKGQRIENIKNTIQNKYSIDINRDRYIIFYLL